jgi:CSLREA domain-containing protein/uncharacterized repeat protein (TIGR01451 family)
MIELKRMSAFLVAALCLVVPATSAAATYTVNTTADGPGECAVAGATCTLRGALAAATVGGAGTNTVVVPAGTYGLTEGVLNIASFENGTVDVVGAGARKTIIDAGGASRALQTEADTTVLEGLTVTGGAAKELGGEEYAGDGGGILIYDNAEAATLRGVAISGNTAMLNGGGVAAPPESTGGVGKSVTVENSTISGNKVSGGAVEGLGGGLYVLGELKMVNSTVTGNAAESTAGLQEGGGVFAGPSMTEVATTSTAIVNSTIAGNAVGMGGTGGGLSIYNPGGVIEPSSSLTNTILYGNKVGEAESNCGTLTITSKNDLSGDASCTFTDAASKKSTNPLLGALANNGGETDTMALAAGSPAIDAGTAEGCPATDQRGVARPVGAACDIGAYEYQPPAATVTPLAAPASADLRLTIKAKPKKPRPTKKLTFTVTVANAGPSAATGVVFTGTVPATAKKVAGKGLAKKACKLGKAKKGKRSLSCQLGTLAAGQSLAFRIPVKAKRKPRKLVVSGRATSAVPDPTPAKAKAVAKLKG